MIDYPKVSVVTITNNHENYITQTLDGVIMQDYPGEIEFIIANDNSPDATDKVVEDYFSNRRIPDNFIIKYTRHKSNKGMMPNFIWAMEEASGKYIALCEGDDYWTDPQKLHKQVYFLEENEEYVLCFANRDILKNDIIETFKPLTKQVSFTKSEIPYIHVPTLTAVFKNILQDIPPKMHRTICDASLFLYMSQFGKFYKINESMAVYRTHSGGIYSGSSELTNHRRSVNVRLSAWKYLKNIDKFSLADVLIDWIVLKKNLERSNRMLFSYFRSLCLEYYFVFYIYLHKSKKN